MLKATPTFAAVGFGAIEMMTGRVRMGKFTGGVEARLSETLVTTMVAMPAVASKLCGTLTVITVPLFEDGTSVADPAGAVKTTRAPVNCPESCRKLVPVIVSVVLPSPANAPLGVTFVRVGVCGVNTVNGRAFETKLPLCTVMGNVPSVPTLFAESGAWACVGLSTTVPVSACPLNRMTAPWVRPPTACTMMVGAGDMFSTTDPGLTLVSVSWIVNVAGIESAPSAFCTYTT